MNSKFYFNSLCSMLQLVPKSNFYHDMVDSKSSLYHFTVSSSLNIWATQFANTLCKYVHFSFPVSTDEINPEFKQKLPNQLQPNMLCIQVDHLNLSATICMLFTNRFATLIAKPCLCISNNPGGFETSRYLQRLGYQQIYSRELTIFSFHELVAKPRFCVQSS